MSITEKAREYLKWTVETWDVRKDFRQQLEAALDVVDAVEKWEGTFILFGPDELLDALAAFRKATGGDDETE